MFHFVTEFFDKSYYTEFLNCHTPQQLTESNKPDISYRKGVYLSNVSPDGKFNLLRCSSNLQGPTENFSEYDTYIVAKANKHAKTIFDNPAELNHALAQVYYNHTIDGRVKRAKIPAHSDKTKDMPENGIMVFGTFYNPAELSDKKYHVVDGNV